MSLYYILKDKKVVPVVDCLTWAKFFDDIKNRRVNETVIGESRISTVFLGLDHSFFGNCKPVLWETMVFGGALDGEMDRCSGEWEEAQAMHEKMVNEVRNTEGSNGVTLGRKKRKDGFTKAS